MIPVERRMLREVADFVREFNPAMAETLVGVVHALEEFKIGDPVQTRFVIDGSTPILPKGLRGVVTGYTAGVSGDPRVIVNIPLPFQDEHGSYWESDALTEMPYYFRPNEIEKY
jgi:hypothetical protein